jgi:hypothetical protein
MKTTEVVIVVPDGRGGDYVLALCDTCLQERLWEPFTEDLVVVVGPSTQTDCDDCCE